jgi:hypothetical protein
MENEILSREALNLIREWSAQYDREVASCDDDDFGLLSARDRKELGLD